MKKNVSQMTNKDKKEILVREGPNIRFEHEVYEHERQKSQ
jgi:hypothetical protein